jgi:hypothetical protein
MSTTGIGFLLKRIATEQFAMIEQGYAKGESVAFKTGIQFAVDREEQIVGVFVQVSFLQKENPFLLLEVVVEFEIHEEAWNSFLHEAENQLVVPQSFLTHLTMISVGTVRGILHAKTENTDFNRFIVPTINVAERVNKDGVFPLKAED